MPTTQAVVFSTPELLELILSHLPLLSLLRTRLVSPHLNNLIQTSPLLQQKLFFRPHTTPSTSWHANPLLRQHFAPFFSVPQDRSKSPYSRNMSVIRQLPWTQDAPKRSAFLRREASWRHMSLTSHASPSLRIVQYVHAMGGNSLSIARVPFSPDTGVTMGAVYDIVHDFLVGNQVASFFVAYKLNEETGEVGVTVGLWMTVQCTIMFCLEMPVSLRSDGEEVTVRTVEWKRERGEEDGDVPGRGEVWGTELTGERGGVE